uniref:peptidylprolyl isomerase n=1 Tax=Caenorhabditis tropicalis TaxID=1561998 RepID=A0A1I7TAD9_9PELO
MTFNERAFSVTLTGLLASIFIVILNFRLLWRFQNSPLRTKPEYHLFKIRFIIDILYSFTVSIYYTSLIVSYLNPFILFHYKTLFIGTLLSSNVVSTRFILGAFISTERLIAVFFPVKFHNNRRKLSIFLFSGLVVLWGMFEDVMYFWVCRIAPFEKPCSILACTWNDCFLQYWTGTKLVIGAFTCSSSLILFLKLLFLKRSMRLNSDLTRVCFSLRFQLIPLLQTNYLCIGDALLTLLFDFSPFLITLIFKTQLLSADIYGPYNATAKSVSCLVDAVIATFILNQKTSKPIQIRSDDDGLEVTITKAIDAAECEIKSAGGDVVDQYYKLTDENGAEIGSNFGKKPYTFTLGRNQVIPGMDRAMRGMCIGEIRKVVIPPKLGFAKDASGQPLYYTVQLVNLFRANPGERWVTEEGIQIEQTHKIEAEKCRKAEQGDKIYQQYVLRLEDNTLVDSSYSRNAPFVFRLRNREVIDGMDIAMNGMCEGERRRVVIPSEYGYGAQGSPPEIPGGARLFFEIVLEKLVKRDEL